MEPSPICPACGLYTYVRGCKPGACANPEGAAELARGRAAEEVGRELGRMVRDATGATGATAADVDDAIRRDAELQREHGDIGEDIGPGTPEGARRHRVSPVLAKYICLGQHFTDFSGGPDLVVTRIDRDGATVDVMAMPAAYAYFGPDAPRGPARLARVSAVEDATEVWPTPGAPDRGGAR